MRKELALFSQKTWKGSILGLILAIMLVVGMMFITLTAEVFKLMQAYAEDIGTSTLPIATVTLTDENGDSFEGNAEDGYCTTFTGEDIPCNVTISINGQDATDFNVTVKDSLENIVDQQDSSNDGRVAVKWLYSAGIYTITVEPKVSSLSFASTSISFEIKPHEVTFVIDDPLKSDAMLEHNDAIKFLENHIEIENDLKNDKGIFSPDGIKAWVSVNDVELADDGRTQTIKYTVFVGNSTSNQVVKPHDVQTAVVELSDKAFPDARTYANVDMKQGNKIIHSPEYNEKPYALKAKVWVQETSINPSTNLVERNMYAIQDDQYILKVTDRQGDDIEPDSLIEEGEYTVSIVPADGANFSAPETRKVYITESSEENLSSELKITVNPSEVEYNTQHIMPNILIEAFIGDKWVSLPSKYATFIIGEPQYADVYDVNVMFGQEVMQGKEYYGYVTFENAFTISQRPIANCYIAFNGEQILPESTLSLSNVYPDKLNIERYLYNKLDIYHDDNLSKKIYGATSFGDPRCKDYIVTADVDKKEFTITGSWNYSGTLTYQFELVDSEEPENPNPPVVDPPTPVDPNPIEPEDPDTPDVPDEPTDPADPDTPGLPDTPVDPIIPEDPETPTEPVDPVIPDTPDEPGTPTTGWVETEDGWQYKDDSGTPTADTWQKVNGKWYHFDDTGYMQTGWVKDNNTWYYLNSAEEGIEGAMATGWKEVDNNWYYLNTSGVMQTGWQSINGAWYHLKASGAMTTGWINDNGTWYYCNKVGEGTEGKMATGWKEIDGKWYNFNTSGVMLTGWQKINGKWYLLNSKHDGAYGTMLTGWQKVNNTWYYLSDSGVMQTGWQQINGSWYYLNPDGSMAANTWVGNYYVDASGKWISAS